MTKRLPGGLVGGDCKRLGQYIRARRKQLGYRSHFVFADVCQLSPRTVADIERGLDTRIPTASTIAKLELTLGWNVGDCGVVARGGEPMPGSPRAIQGPRNGVR